MCGHSLAASVGGGSRLVKAVSVVVDGSFSFCPKPCGEGLSKLLGSSQRRVIMCVHSLAASVSGGIPFGESRADGCRWWLSLLPEAVRHLLVSFSGLAKLLGSSQRRVIMCGHSLAASVGGLSRLVKAVPMIIDGGFLFCPKPFGVC